MRTHCALACPCTSASPHPLGHLPLCPSVSSNKQLALSLSLFSLRPPPLDAPPKTKFLPAPPSHLPIPSRTLRNIIRPLTRWLLVQVCACNSAHLSTTRARRFIPRGGPSYQDHHACRFRTPAARKIAIAMLVAAAACSTAWLSGIARSQRPA